ncbi:MULTISPECIES: hypothetical protein [unclassified Knoellia]|uniref:hypothetical protein n=1 Tax=Knoellia altitudinis TaxID=3404795 RepID=UPI0036095D5B
MKAPLEGGGGWYPAQYLVDPVPKDVAGAWGDVNDWYDKFNPSLGKWALMAWEKFSGADIGEIWGELLAGDWEQVAKLAAALTNLGKFCDDFSDALDAHSGIMDGDWDGEAAQAASVWFISVSAALDTMKGNLDEAAKGFNEAALGIHECFETVKSGIETIVDLAITIGISLAATAASSWTGAGLLIGGSAIAAQVALAVSKVSMIKDAIELATLAARGVIGVTASLAGPAGNFSTVHLPSVYENNNL